jgi:hypothetical protein
MSGSTDPHDYDAFYEYEKAIRSWAAATAARKQADRLFVMGEIFCGSMLVALCVFLAVWWWIP